MESSLGEGEAGKSIFCLNQACVNQDGTKAFGR